MERIVDILSFYIKITKVIFPNCLTNVVQLDEMESLTIFPKTNFRCCYFEIVGKDMKK